MIFMFTVLKNGVNFYLNVTDITGDILSADIISNCNSKSYLLSLTFHHVVACLFRVQKWFVKREIFDCAPINRIER